MKSTDLGKPTDTGFDRRKLLAGVGLGTAGALSAAALRPTEALADMVRQEVQVLATQPDRFGRMFPNLPSFMSTQNPAFERTVSALADFGNGGRRLNANDALGAGPVALIVDPQLSVNNPNNPNQTAGMTFLGQFLDHDMTFDQTSRLSVATPPENSPNSRTPGLDLDSLYGGGPVANPEFYNPNDRAKMRIESGGRFEDVPRQSNGTAIISDPRNDENLVISGLQAAFIKFHNRVVDEVVRAQNPGLSTEAAFAQARQIVTWHYQWIILHEFLPLTIGQDRVNNILANGRRWYTPPLGQHYIPVEFQGAAYRFGHSQVRPSYRVNMAGNPDGSPFFAMIFDPAGQGQADPIDMRGGARAPRRFIGWQTFFDFPGAFDPGTTNPAVRPNKRIDTRISTPLFRLPLSAISSGDAPIALPVRNLLRHITWQIASGQSIAQAIGAPVLGASSFPELGGYGVALESNTPLWYYVLKEAELLEQGLRLGPVGSTIVGEVFIGLLQLAPGSYLRDNPGFRPTLPARTAGTFRMVDLLTYAQVDPVSRGQ
ncbi:heme peroxidase family protein [Actinomycetes bacterium KLBMP 9797]